jgi:ABC-2 type transport system permease protein
MRIYFFEFLLLIKAELKREVLYIIRYPFESLSFVFFMYIILMAIFLGMSQLSGQNGLNINHERMVIGYSLMQFIMGSQMGWSGQISNESQTGTLEQLSISGHSLAAVLLARGIAMFPRQITSFFLLLWGYTLAIPEVNIHMSNMITAIVFLFFTSLGVYGIAYIFAGLTLLFKRVGFFFQIINFAFLGLFWQNRENLAVNSWSAIAYDSFPLTLGMKNLFHVFTTKDPSVILPLLNQLLFSGIFIIFGYILFKIMEKKARDLALLSQY